MGRSVAATGVVGAAAWPRRAGPLGQRGTYGEGRAAWWFGAALGGLADRLWAVAASRRRAAGRGARNDRWASCSRVALPWGGPWRAGRPSGELLARHIGGRGPWRAERPPGEPPARHDVVARAVARGTTAQRAVPASRCRALTLARGTTVRRAVRASRRREAGRGASDDHPASRSRATRPERGPWRAGRPSGAPPAHHDVVARAVARGPTIQRAVPAPRTPHPPAERIAPPADPPGPQRPRPRHDAVPPFPYVPR